TAPGNNTKPRTGARLRALLECAAPGPTAPSICALLSAAGGALPWGWRTETPFSFNVSVADKYIKDRFPVPRAPASRPLRPVSQTPVQKGRNQFPRRAFAQPDQSVQAPRANLAP